MEFRSRLVLYEPDDAMPKAIQVNIKRTTSDPTEAHIEAFTGFQLLSEIYVSQSGEDSFWIVSGDGELAGA